MGSLSCDSLTIIAIKIIPIQNYIVLQRNSTAVNYTLSFNTLQQLQISHLATFITM